MPRRRSPPIDLRSLFRRGAPVRPKYRSEREEIAAVRDGEKPISVFSMLRGDVEKATRWYRDIVELALAAELTVTIQPPRKGQTVPGYEHVDVFVSRPDGAWRIPAIGATRAIGSLHPWSDGIEHLESHLLGYSEADVAARLAHERARRVGWGVATVHVLMSAAQGRRVQALGAGFPPAETDEPMFAFDTRTDLVPDGKALRRLARRYTVVRFGVPHATWQRIFGPRTPRRGPEVIHRALSERDAVALNPHLRSRLQRWTAKGWR